MVASTGTAAAPPSSHHPPQLISLSKSPTSSGKGVSGTPHASSSDIHHQRYSQPQTDGDGGDGSRTARDNQRYYFNGNVDFSGSSGNISRSSRRNSLDVVGYSVDPTTAATRNLTTATTSRARPALRLHSHSLDQVPQVGSSASLSPQRREQHPFTDPGTNSSITTPSTATFDAPQYSQQLPFQGARAARNGVNNSLSSPSFSDLDLRRAESDDPFLDPQLLSSSSRSTTTATLYSSSSSSYHQHSHKISDGDFEGNDTEPPTPKPKTRTREHRSYSQKKMLSSALQKANTAVTLDNAENFEGAMEAYSDACVLLGQVMMRAGGGDDKKKLQAIQETYTQRIEQLKFLSPPKPDEKQLPARPLTEEYADQESLYPVEDCDSAIIMTAGTATGNRYVNGSGRTAIVPPRRDSLYIGPDQSSKGGSLSSLPIIRSKSSEHSVPPLSPSRPPLSPRKDNMIDPELLNRRFLEDREPEMMSRSYTENRDSFTFGVAAISPKYTSDKDRHYGIRRSLSDASSASSRRSSSHRQSNLSSTAHSRQGSEVSTSWLNTIDESGGSVSGESSPGWTRNNQNLLDVGDDDDDDDELEREFEDNFDMQLDAAVEAAYDDGYEVDYNYDRDEEILTMRSPRLNVERAKERVRQVEREMELEIEKERQRKLERERLVENRAKLDSEMDFYIEEDEDDESEEERMLDEMTRGYTLDDFEFNLGSKSALPRESISTIYSDSTLPGDSVSTRYSSGTTWASSGSHNMTASKSLQTVAEAPATPPPHPPPTGTLPPKPSSSTTSLNSSPSRPPSSGMNLITGLAITKSAGVRSRRLSALCEPLEPLMIETSVPGAAAMADISAIPTTVVRGPSPQPQSQSAEQPPAPPMTPITAITPLNILSKSAGAAFPLSRPVTAGGIKDPQLPDPPATAQPIGINERKPSSPTMHGLEPPGRGLTAIPMAKTMSDDGYAQGPRSGSSAIYTPRIHGIPGSLRQIQSSASLKSRNLASPDTESPEYGLYTSSSASNLRSKTFSRSITPATPGMTPMPPQTAGLPSGGMHLFDSKIHSPTTPSSADVLASTVPAPLEPCPPEPLSKPFWLMRSLYQTIAHPRGGYISTRLFVPREVWFIKGVKIRAVDDKICACDLISAALSKLAIVDQEDVNSIYLEMQSLEGVLDRAQALLAKKLGSEVGAAGAKALYGGNDITIPEGGVQSDMVTKTTNVNGGKSYFSLRKLRTKNSNQALNSSMGSSGDFYGSGSLPMAGANSENSQQPKRNLENVSFGGPHAAYISALARLFDGAQVLDRLTVFDEETFPKKANIKTRIGLELSQRHAAEFFGLYICRFVLADVSLLLDKFVKRGSEWVAQ